MCVWNLVAWDERDTWMRRDTHDTVGACAPDGYACSLRSCALLSAELYASTQASLGMRRNTHCSHTAPRERRARTPACQLSLTPRTCPGGTAVCEGTRVETHRHSSRRVGPDRHVLTTSSSGPRHVTKDSPAQQLGAGLTWLKTLLKPVPRPHAAAAPRAARSQAH